MSPDSAASASAASASAAPASAAEGRSTAAPALLPSDPPAAAFDLWAHSRRALDWPVLLDRLAAHAHTVPGAEAARSLRLAEALEDVERAYAEVKELDELAALLERPPMGGIVDCAPLLSRLERGGLLDLPELRELVGVVLALDRLGGWLRELGEAQPTLAARGPRFTLEADLIKLLSVAFDELGELSGRAFPELGRLRQRCAQLEAQIRDMLEEYLRDEAFGLHLQDRFITEREGRFVLPMKVSAPRALGIVHATSQTGETVFMEPAAVVVRSNLLREARFAVDREVRRIIAELCGRLGAALPGLTAALDEALAVDLALCRQGLGRELQGVIPEVKRGGVLRLRQARHPVLVLRGVDVVANDLRLDGRQPGLILTGPNTGGKTVAMKTLGLMALLVRAGVPLPAAEGCRVDLFDRVVADVGDLQDVSGDLSTFSGHVRVLKAALEAAGPHSLILLDEAGVGTDPAQGAAIARAALEALIGAGGRVCATTHYAEVKALSAADPRFGIAAAQYAHGRPTYRMEPGHIGQSHAFSIARQLALPEAVVTRARALLDEGTRQLGDLTEALEAAQAEARLAAVRLDAQAEALSQREKRLERKEKEVAHRKQQLEQEVAKNFARRLKDREDEVKGLIAALQERPDLSLAGRSLKQIREIQDELRAPPPEPPPPEPAPTPLVVGERVHLRTLDRVGEVAAVLPKDRYELAVGGLRLKLPREELLRLDGRGRPIPAPGREPRPAPAPAPAPAAPLIHKAPQVDHKELQGLRIDANTLDMRGVRVDEALSMAADFLDRMSLTGLPVAFLLHGHGTGALKKAVRDWLPACGYVEGWRPCYPGEGGDAYTIVGLR
jgi:DNA mismatch repair protein MutS2